MIALTYAALCMAGQARHMRGAVKQLMAEIDRQVLADGGHVSRNPGALIELLLDFLPLRQAFQARNLAPPQQLNNAIDRMMPMMRFFRHGDGAFAHFNGMGPTPPDLMATCWLALDDATRENGCLRVLPGTHRKGALAVEVIQEYERRAEEGSLPEEVPLVLKAGECSLHHGHLLHCSTPNLSGQRRRGYATHYVSARCRYTGPEPKPEFPLVRGEAVSGVL